MGEVSTGAVQGELGGHTPGASSVLLDLELYKAAFGLIDDAMVVLDAAGKVRKLNPAGERLLGWRDDEAKGQPSEAVFVLEVKGGQTEGGWLCVLSEGKAVEFGRSTLVVVRGGAEISVSGKAAPVRGGRGEVAGTALVLRKDAADGATLEVLRQEARRFRASFEHSPVGMSMTGVDGSMRVNRAFCELVGYSPEELLRLKWQDITHPDDIRENKATIAGLNAGRSQSARFEKRYVHKSGHVVWAEVATALHRDERGRSEFFVTSALDITARKRMEAELESMSRFPAENPHPVLRVRNDGNILYANASSRDLLIHWGAAVGQSIPTSLEPVIAAAISSGREQPLDVRCGERNLSLQFVPIQGAGYVNIYGRDDSERVRTEVANREMESFSYSVSHDLRAPLRAIDGFTRILADEHARGLDAEGLRVCGIIRQNTERMGQLIDDLLMLSRLGRAEMRRVEVDMGDMVRSVFEGSETSERRQRVELRVGNLPPCLVDPSLIRQVWANLLGNAVKFSSKRDRPVIEVSGEVVAGENVYTVRDNGAGFDSRYGHKLFGVFERLHSSREFEGTGVGLALVAQVIRRHGGRVWAEGEVDRGATFHFALPRKES